MKLMLQLSCYNGSRYLPYLFASLRAQTFQDWRLMLIDNGSTDSERAAIAHAIQFAGFPIEYHRLEKNIGFSGAHNFLFSLHKNESDYVALLNDDAMLEPEYLSSLVEAMETHPELASVSGEIYRWDYDARMSSTQGRTGIIDTLGLHRSATGSVKDIGSGVMGHFDPSSDLEYVFGVSGCLPCYRVRSVLDVSKSGTLFHPSFVGYKEDVELAFRLHTAGYTSATVPSAIAYHRRSLRPDAKRYLSDDAQFHSYRNHLWIHFIHTSLLDFLSSAILILPYELLKLLYWLIRKPEIVFKTVEDTKIHWTELMQDREYMRVIRNASSGQNNIAPIPPDKFDATIALVIVSHNDLNKDGLRSIQRAREKCSVKTAVVVVDNKSTTYEAHAFVKATIPDAHVILRNGDFGYGRSNVRGTKEVNAEFYFFLNPDTVLSDVFILEHLFAYMQSHADVGILAPKIEYPDGRLQETCRRFPPWFIPFIQRTRFQETTFGKKHVAKLLMQDVAHDVECPVDWAQGSALFVRAHFARMTGYFDHRYWMYFEDVDLCRSMQVYGKQVVYLPSTVLQHVHVKESAKYKSLLENILKNKVARAHILSWLLYLLKWNIRPLPQQKK